MGVDIVWVPESDRVHERGCGGIELERYASTIRSWAAKGYEELPVLFIPFPDLADSLYSFRFTSKRVIPVVNVFYFDHAYTQMKS